MSGAAPRVAVLVVGDELTAGDCEDSNAPWIARLARERGCRIAGFAVVGDEVAVVAQSLQRLLADADLVVVTGGLGPTADDLTRDGVAAALALRLRTRPEVIASLRTFYGSEPGSGSARQAEIPEGALLLENPRGTAPGFLVRHAGKLVACVPGVPSEMRAMVRLLFEQHVPGAAGPPARKFLVCGPRESDLGERLADLMDMSATGARLGITTGGGVHTVAVRGPDAAAVAALAEAVKVRLGEDLVAEGEATLAEVVVAALAAANATLATAESCTGGLLAGAVTAVPGSSAVFREGVIVYANEAKVARLGVPAELLAAHGAVSEEVARAMAEGCRARSGTTYAVAITGIAGPDGGTADKPVGTVVLAVAGPAATRVVRRLWKGSRSEIRARAVNLGLELVRRALLPSRAS